MFLEEWSNELGLDFGAIIKELKILNIDNRVLVIDAMVDIVVYSIGKLVLKTPKKMIYIYGNNLGIHSYSKNQIVIVGQIYCVSNREVNSEDF